MTQADKPQEVDFAAQLAELEAITVWFESSEVDLSEALTKFERGMELAAALKEHLQTIENRVVKIKQRFDVPSAAQVEAAEEEEPGEPAALDLFDKQ